MKNPTPSRVGAVVVGWLALLFTGSSLAQSSGRNAPLEAGARVDFATFAIPVHVESAHQGLFVELMREVAVTARFQHFRIEVMSPLRALRGLRASRHDAVFPALDSFFESGEAFVRTAEPIDCKEDFVFTARGTALLRSLADLRGKVVGITHGYPYSSEVMAANGFTLQSAPSDELNLRKLVAGRIDAFVLDEKTGIKAAQALGLSAAVQYDGLAPVSRQEVYVAFPATARGRELAGRTSEALRQLKGNGRYQAITRGITFARGCGRR